MTQSASWMLRSISSQYMSLGPRRMMEAAVRTLVPLIRISSSAFFSSSAAMMTTLVVPSPTWEMMDVTPASLRSLKTHLLVL